jgi:hypothetical protein
VTIQGGDEGDVIVEVLGGTVGRHRHDGDRPEFPDGERVLLFLKREGALRGLGETGELMKGRIRTGGMDRSPCAS